MNTLITICARGGSKGIPGKNIRPLGGHPLLSYTLKIAREFSEIYKADISLSSDDGQILQAAGELGFVTDYVRPEYLATDSAGKIDTIKDLLEFEEKKRSKQYDFVLDLDVTSPLRTLNDLIESFNQIKMQPEALTIFSVNPANRNPYFNMVELRPDGFCSLVKRSERGVMLSRQSAPKVFDLNASFYFYRRKFFETGLSTPITDRSLIYVMDHLCFDLDHEYDFDFMEFLLTSGKIKL